MTDSDLQVALAKKRPRGVSRIISRRGTDSTGDPAAWVAIVLKDAMANSFPRPTFNSIRAWAEEAVRAVDPSLWVYVSFRTESEQKELDTPNGSRK